MQHFSCDVCGRDMADDEDRHVVKIQLYAARTTAELTEADLDADNLEAVAQTLETNEAPEPISTTREYRYDLCPACRKRYERAPLVMMQSAQKFDFSEN
jgi:hypothetical protein